MTEHQERTPAQRAGQALIVGWLWSTLVFLIGVPAVFVALGGASGAEGWRVPLVVLSFVLAVAVPTVWSWALHWRAVPLTVSILAVILVLLALEEVLSEEGGGVLAYILPAALGVGFLFGMAAAMVTYLAALRTHRHRR